MMNETFIQTEVNWLKTKKAKLFFCKDCIEIGWMSYKEAKENPICPFCKSPNIEFITKRDLKKYVRKKYALKEKISLEMALIKTEVKKTLEGFDYRITKEERDRIYFEYPSVVVIEGVRKVKIVRIHFHWFGRKEITVMNNLIETIKDVASKLKLIRLIKIIITVDSRPDHCYLSRDEMYELGFREEGLISDYYKEISLEG